MRLGLNLSAQVNVCDLCDTIAAVIYEVGQFEHVEF